MKYGKDSFTMKLLIVAHTQEIADHWECHFIERYDTIKNGYNIRGGGSRGRISESTREKLRQKAIGRVPSEETRKKLSVAGSGERNPFYGKTHTEEAKEKMSRKGMKHSSESLAKMSKASTGRMHTLETRKIISEKLKGKSRITKGGSWSEARRRAYEEKYKINALEGKN
jgi:group I intron endonuclease